MSKKDCNIGGDPNDQFYRYKREKAFVQHIGNETHFQNLHRIATQLIVTPNQIAVQETYAAIVKLLKKKLSTNVTEDKKTKNIIIRGIVKADDIESVIIEFTVKYILCPVCKIPEWSGKLCTACGNETKKN